MRRGDYFFSLPSALTFEAFLDSSFFLSTVALFFLGATSLAFGSDFFFSVTTTGFLALVYLLASTLALETGFASPSRSTNSIKTIGASSPLR